MTTDKSPRQATIAKEQTKPMHEQNARFAIDGAIAYGMQGTNKPPEADHWLMEYWEIGHKIAAQAGQDAPLFWYDPTTSVERRRMTDEVDQVVITGASVRWGHSTTPLYAAPPAPATALAVVQAALEAAAVIAESFCACDSGIEQDAVNFVAKNKSRRIRAINPQSIIDAASGK